jgi:hypothetical protein
LAENGGIATSDAHSHINSRMAWASWLSASRTLNFKTGLAVLDELVDEAVGVATIAFDSLAVCVVDIYRQLTF